MKQKDYAVVLLDTDGDTQYIARWNIDGELELRDDVHDPVVMLSAEQSEKLVEYLADMEVLRRPAPEIPRRVEVLLRIILRQAANVTDAETVMQWLDSVTAEEGS